MILIADDSIEDHEKRMYYAIEVRQETIANLLEQWINISKDMPPYVVVAYEDESEIILESYKDFKEIEFSLKNIEPNTVKYYAGKALPHADATRCVSLLHDIDAYFIHNSRKKENYSWLYSERKEELAINARGLWIKDPSAIDQYLKSRTSLDPVDRKTIESWKYSESETFIYLGERPDYELFFSPKRVCFFGVKTLSGHDQPVCWGKLPIFVDTVLIQFGEFITHHGVFTILGCDIGNTEDEKMSNYIKLVIEAGNQMEERGRVITSLFE